VKGTLTPAAGLAVLKFGESVESVATKSGVFRLLATRPGVELHEGAMVRGKHLNLVPFDDSADSATEVYYIVSGSLRTVLPTGVITVRAGDVLVTEGLSEPVIFETLEDVRFLYFSTRPTFNQVGENLRELMRLAGDVEIRDGYTAGHCLRMQRLAFATGRELGLPHQRQYNLEYGSYLHDVGKLQVSQKILTKRGSLTEEEWAEMRRHPGYGKTMLERTFLNTAAQIVEQHHERLDGSGYPFGLRGDEILLESLIVGVADTYDAMVTERPYRPASTRDRALGELRDAAGARFPPDVVDAFRAVEGRASH
jgi:HD-GYP domain-containing protein (c-di-GMP phosphodiesterase class II)